MKEHFYDEEDISSEDEYFDDSEDDEIEGGGYSLKGIDDIYGGGVNKWSRFAGKLMRKGYTMKEAGVIWKSGRTVASRIPAKSGSSRKKSTKKTAKKSSSDGRRRKICHSTGKKYLTQRNYDKYCPEAMSTIPTLRQNVAMQQNPLIVPHLGPYMCPLTGKIYRTYENYLRYCPVGPLYNPGIMDKVEAKNRIWQNPEAPPLSERMQLEERIANDPQEILRKKWADGNRICRREKGVGYTYCPLDDKCYQQDQMTNCFTRMNYPFYFDGNPDFGFPPRNDEYYQDIERLRQYLKEVNADVYEDSMYYVDNNGILVKVPINPLP